MELFNPKYASPYYSQISSQCEHAIEAMRKMHNIFEPSFSGQKLGSNIEVFMLASSFLSSVNNIHKTFNNHTSQFSKERSNFLQTIFKGIHNKLPSRNIRNSIEHFDERLDAHVVNHGIFIDQNVVITPKKLKEDEEGIFTNPEIPVFRHLIYVSSTKEFYIQLLGEEMNMSEVDLIVREIKMKCDELLYGHLSSL